jgi:hypothetical protein
VIVAQRLGDGGAQAGVNDGLVQHPHAPCVCVGDALGRGWAGMRDVCESGSALGVVRTRGAIRVGRTEWVDGPRMTANLLNVERDL